MAKYRLKSEHFEQPVGTVVYDCKYHSYGLKGDDERMTGIEHEFVTLKEDGDYPGFTIPKYLLEKIE